MARGPHRHPGTASGRAAHARNATTLTRAFHGRSGYTLSLTNTDSDKTGRFPKFGWSRIGVPTITFPLSKHLDQVKRAEERARRPRLRRRSNAIPTTSPASSLRPGESRFLAASGRR
jgi:4-aminobutyrate aminotransferase-like enzyme